jgi:hypothetical protein
MTRPEVLAICGHCAKEFNAASGARGRLKKWCSAACRSAAQYWANRDRYVVARQRRSAANRESERARKRVYAAAHRNQERERARSWREANSDRHKANVMKRRAMRRGAAVGEPISLEALFQRDGRRCHICTRLVKRADASMDHLIPLSLGGEHSWANVALAHLACNKQRGAGRLPAQLRLIG